LIRQRARGPNLRRGFAPHSKPSLTRIGLPDPMHDFDAGFVIDAFENVCNASIGPNRQLDRSMVLFNQIIEVFRRSNLRPIAASMCGKKLPGRSMRPCCSDAGKSDFKGIRRKRLPIFMLGADYVSRRSSWRGRCLCAADWHYIRSCGGKNRRTELWTSMPPL